MVHTLELNLGRTPKSYTTAFPNVSGCLLPIVLFLSMSGPTVTKYLNLFHFRPEKGVSGSLRLKDPELGVVIMTL